MQAIFAVVAGCLSILSFLPYISDIIKNKTHPNLVTWATWTSVALINFIAAAHNHIPHSAILSGAVALGDGVIVVLSIRKGVKKYIWFDFLCQSIAVIGVLIWILTDNPNIAVALSMLVVLVGALPTWRHAWIKPYEETWEGFAIGIVAGILTLLSLQNHTFVAVAFPVSLVINCSVVVYIIVSRRRIGAKRQQA